MRFIDIIQSSDHKSKRAAIEQWIRYHDQINEEIEVGKNKQMLTPLQICVDYRAWHLAQILMAAGADPFLENSISSVYETTAKLCMIYLNKFPDANFIYVSDMKKFYVSIHTQHNYEHMFELNDNTSNAAFIELLGKDTALQLVQTLNNHLNNDPHFQNMIINKNIDVSKKSNSIQKKL